MLYTYIPAVSFVIEIAVIDRIKPFQAVYLLSLLYSFVWQLMFFKCRSEKNKESKLIC